MTIIIIDKDSAKKPPFPFMSRCVSAESRHTHMIRLMHLFNCEFAAVQIIAAWAMAEDASRMWHPVWTKTVFCNQQLFRSTIVQQLSCVVTIIPSQPLFQMWRSVAPASVLVVSTTVVWSCTWLLIVPKLYLLAKSVGVSLQRILEFSTSTAQLLHWIP